MIETLSNNSRHIQDIYKRSFKGIKLFFRSNPNYTDSIESVSTMIKIFNVSNGIKSISSYSKIYENKKRTIR